MSSDMCSDTRCSDMVWVLTPLEHLAVNRFGVLFCDWKECSEPHWGDIPMPVCQLSTSIGQITGSCQPLSLSSLCAAEKNLMDWCRPNAREESLPSEGVMHTCLWPSFIGFYFLRGGGIWIQKIYLYCGVSEAPTCPSARRCKGQVCTFRVCCCNCLVGWLPWNPTDPTDRIQRWSGFTNGVFCCTLVVIGAFFQENEVGNIQAACSVITGTVNGFMNSICGDERPLKKLKLVCEQKTMFDVSFFL